jgi:nitroreductase
MPAPVPGPGKAEDRRGGRVEFFDAVAGRRSVRSFRDEQVAESDLERVLRACRDAPSAGNLQAYEIYLIAGPAQRAALARGAFGQGFLEEAPVVLAFCTHAARARRYGERGAGLYALQDATIAAAYAQLAAVALGLATCWVGAFDEEKVTEALGLPPGQRPVVLLPLGRAAETPGPASRRPLEDLVHRIS